MLLFCYTLGFLRNEMPSLGQLHLPSLTKNMYATKAISMTRMAERMASVAAVVVAYGSELAALLERPPCAERLSTCDKLHSVA